MADDEAGAAALEKLNQAIQEYVNTVETPEDAEGGALVRGWALTVETMILREDGRAAYRIWPVQGEQTSNAQAMGLLRHGAECIATCLLHHHED